MTEILNIEDYPVTFTLKPDPEHFYGDWTYGWKVTIGKDQYGDFIALTDKEKTDSLPEAREVLTDQVREVIKAVSGKTHLPPQNLPD